MKTRRDEFVNACVWTRPRLSLFVGMGCDVESTAEEGDLSRADRQRIKAHLDDCGDCRRQWSALVRSMSVLSAAATESPVEPHEPTLWEGLAARIESAESARPSVWVRFGRVVLPDSARSIADRAVYRLDRGLSGLPIRIAWVRDTIAHDLPDRMRDVLDHGSRSSSRLVDRLLGALTSPVGLGATAAVGAFIVAASLLHRSEIEGEARIASASAPIPIELQAVPLVLAPARPPAEAPLALEIEARSQDFQFSSTATEPEALAQNSAPLQPPPSATPAPAAKPTAPRVYDYDLERGIPMPPDARIAKPAY